MRYLLSVLLAVPAFSLSGTAGLPVDPAMLPPSPPLLRIYGRRYLYGGRPAAALRCYRRLRRMGYADSPLRYREAQALYRLRRYRAAAAAAAVAVKLDPSRVEALVLLGAAQRRCGAFGAALHSFNRALRLDSACRRAWQEKGGAYFRLARYSEALSAYRRALRLKRGFFALAGAGRACGKLRRWQSAVHYLAAALNAARGRRSGWVAGLLTCYRYRAGVELKRRGRLAESRVFLRAAAAGKGRYSKRARHQLQALSRAGR